VLPVHGLMSQERDKPDYCYTSGCPLASKGTKFVLGCGDPKTAKIGLLLEGPGSEEVSFTLRPEEDRRFYETAKECDAEVAIRKRDYPDLPMRYITRGVPVVGRSGFELVQWAFPAAGLRRSEIFIDNTLRCLPPKNGDSHYPDGAERKLAEAFCRHYDRFGRSQFQPDISIVSLHPAGIIREPTPLWLQVKNLEKARDFITTGAKVLLLAGGKAVKWWLGYGENVTRWQGHYEWNDAASQERRAARLASYASAVPGEKKRGKKTTEREDSSETRAGRRRLNAVEAMFGVE
jgi:hypothetical protein